MNLNAHQQRLWKHMIDIIQDYLDGKTNNFFEVVGNLEGALDASEIQDNDLINQWYELWTPLEIIRAVGKERFQKKVAFEALIKMKIFLQQTILQ